MFQIGRAWGVFQIGRAWGEFQIGRAWGVFQIGRAWGVFQIGRAWGVFQIGRAHPSSRLLSLRPSPSPHERLRWGKPSSTGPRRSNRWETRRGWPP